MRQFKWIFDASLVFLTVALGFFIGLVLVMLAKLIGTGAWIQAIVLVGFAALLYFGLDLLERVFERIFPSGIKPARGTQKSSEIEQRRNRNGRLGFIVGIAIAACASFFVPPEQIMEFF